MVQTYKDLVANLCPVEFSLRGAQGENTKIRQINDAHFRSASCQAKTGGHDKAVKFSVGLIFPLRPVRRTFQHICVFSPGALQSPKINK
jgi:hypothetical protein